MISSKFHTWQSLNWNCRIIVSRERERCLNPLDDGVAGAQIIIFSPRARVLFQGANFLLSRRLHTQHHYIKKVGVLCINNFPPPASRSENLMQKMSDRENFPNFPAFYIFEIFQSTKWRAQQTNKQSQTRYNFHRKNVFATASPCHGGLFVYLSWKLKFIKWLFHVFHANTTPARTSQTSVEKSDFAMCKQGKHNTVRWKWQENQRLICIQRWLIVDFKSIDLKNLKMKLTCKTWIICRRSIPTRWISHVRVVSSEREIVWRRTVALHTWTVIEWTHCVRIRHVWVVAS